ncbi:Hpt domain-containing protein [Sulfurimonas sp. SAG-AH-194-C21]|nr:Hpt domain-containing protein [Sulfurimonas sp. SAG-AH-194-C21]MDF1882347.1 Hpt domain-containing protein [Sulfurimonas sp. SAG-AH-194-C21]
MSYKIDLQKIADELEFDLEDVEMIMDSFLENAKTNLNFMDKAIQIDDFKGITNSAHAIKGSALNLLLDDVGNLARELELNAMEEKNIDYFVLYEKLNLLINGLKNEK